jgi:hypothetical protein
MTRTPTIKKNNIHRKNIRKAIFFYSDLGYTVRKVNFDSLIDLICDDMFGNKVFVHVYHNFVKLRRTEEFLGDSNFEVVKYKSGQCGFIPSNRIVYPINKKKRNDVLVSVFS